MEYAQLGSISSGTLRDEDLLEAFADELERLCDLNKGLRGNGHRRTIIAEARRVEPETERASELINEALPDALNEFAPPFSYFSSSEGDGADFGFWFSSESLDTALQDGELTRFNDLNDIPGDFCPKQNEPKLALVINDHGNMTLYRVRLDHNNLLETKEVWSVV
jgi:hypothetical protein